jgi:hypothetical protein
LGLLSSWAVRCVMIGKDLAFQAVPPLLLVNTLYRTHLSMCPSIFHQRMGADSVPKMLRSFRIL